MKGYDSDVLQTVFHDLPITSFSGWDRVWQMEGILAEHDRGLFRSSSMLCDTMMRDDRIAAVSDTRVSALIASPVEVKPANPSTKAAKIAKEIGGDGEFPGLWSSMFPPSVIGELAWWGNWLGFGVAQILWDTTGTGNVPTTAWSALMPGAGPYGAYGSPYVNLPNGTQYKPAPSAMPGRQNIPKPTRGARWTPHLKVWHPQYIYWDWSVYRLIAMCVEGQVVLPNPDEQTHGDGKWFVWAPHGYQYGWLKAMVRRLAHKYIMRGWNYRDWARYNERHGLPILGAVTPQNASEEVKTRFKNDIANMGNDAVVPLPKGDDPNNAFDVKVIEAKARTYDSFQKFKKELDGDIAITMLGQNLTTDNTGGSGGSKALGQVQNQVRIDKRIEDAKIDEALRKQVLWWDAGYNYGDGELAPIPEHQVEPPEDESKEAATLLALGQAMAAIKLAEPELLDVRALFDRFGLPMLSEEEIAAAKEQSLQEAEEKQERLGPPAAPAVPGAQPDQRRPPPAGAKPGALPPKPGAPNQLSAVPAAIAKRYEFQGLDIAIENPAGSERQWTDRQPDGTEKLGSTRMAHDYGYIEGAIGNDKDEVDCYIGPDELARFAYVVHQQQKHEPDKFDEDKVMMGFASADAAKAAYVSHRDDGEACFGGMSVIPMDRFKATLRRRVGTGKIRAAQTSEAIVALVARLRDGKLLRAPRTAAGKVRATRYVDSLERNGVKLAATIMARDVDLIVREMDEAKDFDDLKTRVVKAYRNKMRPDALAALVKNVNLMAHMAGRYNATREAKGH